MKRIVLISSLLAGLLALPGLAQRGGGMRGGMSGGRQGMGGCRMCDSRGPRWGGFGGSMPDRAGGRYGNGDIKRRRERDRDRTAPADRSKQQRRQREHAPATPLP